MSIMHVQSNQGNAGAHNKDQLGKIFVYGDLVRDGDYDVHAHANLGIIETIDDLGEALAPSFGNTEVPQRSFSLGLGRGRRGFFAGRSHLLRGSTSGL